MLLPKSAKEIKQFLGLAGYYHKFVPRFLDLLRPLTRLTQKDVLFKWTKEFQAVFQMLKDALCEHPILRYPDPANLTCFSQMQASMLGQEYQPNHMMRLMS